VYHIWHKIHFYQKKSNVAKLKFVHSKSIFYFKKCLNLSDFFSYQFRTTFLDNFNFEITLFTKMMSNFCQHSITDILQSMKNKNKAEESEEDSKDSSD